MSVVYHIVWCCEEWIEAESEEEATEIFVEMAQLGELEPPAENEISITKEE